MIINDFLFQFEPEWRSLATPQHAPVLEHTVTAAVSAGLNGSPQSVVHRLEDCLDVCVWARLGAHTLGQVDGCLGRARCEEGQPWLPWGQRACRPLQLRRRVQPFAAVTATWDGGGIITLFLIPMGSFNP